MRFKASAPVIGADALKSTTYVEEVAVYFFRKKFVFPRFLLCHGLRIFYVSWVFFGGRAAACTSTMRHAPPSSHLLYFGHTTRATQPEPHSQSQTTRATQPEPHNQSHTARATQPEPNSQSHTARATQPEPNSQSHTARATQPEPHSQSRTRWTSSPSARAAACRRTRKRRK